MPNPHADNVVDDVIEQVRRAHGLGVAQVWLPQQQNYDAISRNVIAREGVARAAELAAVGPEELVRR